MQIFSVIVMSVSTLLLLIWGICESIGIKKREKAGIEEARIHVGIVILAIAIDFFMLMLILISPEMLEHKSRNLPWAMTTLNIVVYIPCSYRLTIDKDRARLSVRLLFFTKHYPLNEVEFKQKGGFKIKYHGKTIFILFLRYMECTQGLDRLWDERCDLHWQEQFQSMSNGAAPVPSAEGKHISPHDQK